MVNRARSRSTDAAAVGGRSATRRPEKGHRRCATTSNSASLFLQLSRNESPLVNTAAEAVRDDDDDALLVARTVIGGGTLLDDRVEQDYNICSNTTVATVEPPPSPSQLDENSKKNDSSDKIGDQQRTPQQQQQQQQPQDRPPAALGDSSLRDKTTSAGLSAKNSSSTRRAYGVGSLRSVFVKQQAEETARPAAADPLADSSIKGNSNKSSNEQEIGGPVSSVTSEDFSIDANELREEYEHDNDDEEPTKIYNTPRLMDSFRLESLRENRHRGDPWLVSLLFAWMRHWYGVWCSLTGGFGWVTWSLLLVATLLQPVLTLVVLPVAALVLRYGRRIVTLAATSLPATTREAKFLWRWLRQKLRDRWNAFVVGAQRGQAVFVAALVLRYLRRPADHRRRRD